VGLAAATADEEAKRTGAQQRPNPKGPAVLNPRSRVEVLALLAKHELRAVLEQIVSRAAEDEHVPTLQRPRQQQRRLGQEQVDEVVARYVDGESIDALAREYGINRTTVISHLERNGVDRRRNPRKMTDAKVHAAAERYATGISLAAVAAEFDVCDRTLRREFECAGVQTRPRPGG
jgi:transposase-like protein